MKKLILSIFLTMIFSVSSLLSNSVVAASPQQSHISSTKHHSKKYNRSCNIDRTQRMIRKLNLTAEQQQKFKTLFKKTKAKNSDIKEDMRVLKQKNRTLMDNDEFDKSAFKKLANEKGNLVAKKMMLHAKFHFEVKAILTDAQKTKLKVLNKKHRIKRHSN